MDLNFHFHNVGPSTLIMMAYFSKGWKKKIQGATYVASDIDESSILFEPYNLDNTMVVFQDFPNAIHGAIDRKRYWKKSITNHFRRIVFRRRVSGGDPDKLLEIQKQELVEL